MEAEILERSQYRCKSSTYNVRIYGRSFAEICMYIQTSLWDMFMLLYTCILNFSEQLVSGMVRSNLIYICICHMLFWGVGDGVECGGQGGRITWQGIYSHRYQRLFYFWTYLPSRKMEFPTSPTKYIKGFCSLLLLFHLLLIGN